jgi:hypothetical protein
VEPRDLGTAAATYSSLRGLLLVPSGLLLVVAALGNADAGPFRHGWAFLLAVVVLGALWLVLQRRYTEAYGRMRPSPRQEARSGVALVLSAAVMVGVSFLLRSRVSWSLDLPVNAIAVSFALVMLISYAAGAGLRAHHAVVWGALLVTGALPVWTGADPSNVGLVLAGGCMLVSGILDHRAFVGVFGPRGALDGDVGA